MANKKDPNKVKQGKANRDKGYRGETIFRKKFEESDIDCKRKAHPGIKGDLRIETTSLGIEAMEVKNRDSLANYLWDYLEGVEYLGLKKNRKEPLVVMRLDKLIGLLQKLEEG